LVVELTLGTFLGGVFEETQAEVSLDVLEPVSFESTARALVVYGFPRLESPYHSPVTTPAHFGEPVAHSVIKGRRFALSEGRVGVNPALDEVFSEGNGVFFASDFFLVGHVVILCSVFDRFVWVRPLRSLLHYLIP